MNDIRRGFQVYKGPDDHNPFMGLIQKLCFHNRHMMSFNKTGVLSLTQRNIIGRVTVMSVGPYDYIWTYGGTQFGLFIIFVPDITERGFQIRVSGKKDGYEFGEMKNITAGVLRYQFPFDAVGLSGGEARQQYMPYIQKYLGTSHASVGYPGSLFYPDPVNDWHYKYYVLDCTGDESPAFETLWKPPEQVATVGFGEDLLPPWYAMSPLTAHGYHWCYEAAIDQEKRLYSPINTDVTLGADDLVIPDFTVVLHDGYRYNFLYPVFASRFFGKNAYDITVSETGEQIITAFAESIYLSGVVTANIPEGIDPILFFWPWIPYLDEIRSFNLLYYAGRNYEGGGGFEGWFMTPSLATFKKYGIGYYTNLGVYQTQELSEDVASFSDVTKSVNTTDSAAGLPCSCGDCGTGIWSEEKVTSTPAYNSSGTKTIPIGLIGGKIPITMKTTWQQAGSGPLITNTQNVSIVGNYPYASLHSGSLYGLDHWYETCCVTAFLNTHDRVMGHSEVASNVLTLQQVLKVGDDVIFSGESSMHYEMIYSGQDSYHGTINGTVVPPDFVPPVCAGSISFTTQQMSVNQTQNLSWNDNTVYPAARPCEDPMDAFEFSWSLSGGGSLSSTTEQNTVYTSPATNPNCDQNATISLLCNGVVVDTLEIAINSGSTSLAYRALSCREEGFCTIVSGTQTQYQSAYVYIDRYLCNGAYNGHETSICYYMGGVCSPPKPLDCEGCAATQKFTSCGVEYDNSGRLTCEGTALKCGSLCIYGLPPGAVLGEPIDSRTPEQKAAGCCPAALL